MHKGKELEFPSTAPNIQCRVEDPSTLCHFPFLFNGDLQWDSLRDESGKCKCSTEDMESAKTLNDLNNHTSFDSLADCTNCDSSSCPGKSYYYSGFSIQNNKDKNEYKRVSLEECQLLCQKTQGCIFFNFDSATDSCWLKWGLGIYIEGSSTDIFGPKNCPSK